MALVKRQRDCGCGKSLKTPIIKGDPGATGAAGYNGWSPNLGVVDANRPAGPDAVGTTTNLGHLGNANDIDVLKFICWIGGEGTEPDPPANPYVGSSGFFTTLNNATNIRGSQGADGTISDTGWVNLSFKTGYPHSDSAPQFRIVGNRIDFRGTLRIAPAARPAIQGNTAYAVGDSVSEGGTGYRCILGYTSASTPVAPSLDAAHWAAIGTLLQDSPTPDTTYITLSGDGNREAVRFKTDSGGNIPLGTTVGGVVLPASLPNSIVIVNQVLRREVSSDAGLRVGLRALVNNIIIDTSGNIVIGTIMDSEIISTDDSAAGAFMSRINTANITKGEYVPDWRTFKHSLAASGSNAISVSSKGTNKFIDTIDAADANYLGGFIMTLDGTSGFITA